MTLRAISLFSGVGGIDLAAERAGISPTLLCELDKHASSVLARRFPGVPIHPDVSELTPDDLRSVAPDPDRAILLAGFPCTDLSVAGRRLGMGEGTRSGLYWHIPRLLADYPARWVLLENVPGLLSQDRGRAMGAVLGSLADLGYGFAYRVLDSQFFGVPQRRRRVVIVGCLGDSGAAPAQVLLEPEGGDRNSSAGIPTRAQAAGRVAASVGGRSVSSLTASRGGPDDNDAQAGHLVPMTFSGDVAPALGAKSGGQGILTDVEVRRLTPLECERLQGHPDGWTDGQSDAQRYKQMGNGVAVPVFEWVARRLVAVHAATTTETRAAS